MLKSKALWTLALGFMALHIALAALLPLVEDETYYALWASVPSAGYFDHPPMIAWWIAAGQAVLGDSPFAVRLLAVLASALLTFLTYRIAWLYSKDATTAFTAALWGKAMIPFSVLAFAATPDAPSVLFWTAAVWALAELTTSRNPNWWFAVGLFAALGILSKFTDLFFALAILLWLFASREGRTWLPRWQVWAGAALGLVILAPFALWNYQNDWIGLERQFGRVGAEGKFSLGGFVAFWAAFAMLVTPVLFWLAAKSLPSPKVPALLKWLIAPILIYMTGHALTSIAGGQWLVPIYPTLAVIAALGAAHARSARFAAPTGLALGVLIMVIGLWPGKILIDSHNPFTQMRGWDRVTQDIRTRMKTENASWIATDAYGLTGQLSYYFDPQTPVWSLTDPERYLFRGPAPAEICQEKGLLISRAPISEARADVKKITLGADMTRNDGPIVVMRYYTAIISGPTAQAAFNCAAP